MKTLLKITLFISLVLFFSGLNAQSNLKLGDENISRTSGLEDRDRTGAESPISAPSKIYDRDQLSGEQGSMYLNPEWSVGKAYLANHQVLDNIKLRYNIYHGQMQFILKGDTLAFARPDELSCLVFNGMTFIYSEFRQGTKVSNDWFEVVSDGPCMLLCRRVVKYHLCADGSSENSGDDSFYKCCEYYVKKGDKAAELVRQKRKQVACIFNDRQELISEYIKEKNLDVKKRADLAQVIDYYNKLIN